MKKLLLGGLATLVLAAGCGRKKICHRWLSDLPQATVSEADLTLNLEMMRGWRDPMLIVNDKLHYLFVKKDADYHLFRVDPAQKNELVVEFDDPDHNGNVIMDLGDGKVYTLSYNSEVEDYQISPK